MNRARRFAVPVIVALALLGVLGACTAPISTPPPTPDSGSLQVDIAGLEAGTDAVVFVAGPDDFGRALGSSTTLTGLAPGSYTVRAETVVGSAAIATATATVSGSPATVQNDQTATVTVSYASDPGSLQVDVAGLPGGVDAAVSVTGPGGFSQSVTADTTLADLTPGSYTVSASDVLGNEAVVPRLYAFEGGSVDIEVSSSTVARASVGYAPIAGSGRLWLSSNGDGSDLNGYEPDQLASSGAPTPTVEVDPFTIRGEDVAFDGDGNAWVVDFDGGLSRFAADDLVNAGAVTPTTTLSSDGAATPSLASPVGVAFDDAGNLWVGATASSRLEMFTPAQQAAGGAPTPTVIITANGGSLNNPASLAFDAAGTLWVSNLVGSTVVAFSPAQLTVSGAPVPAVTITPDAGSSLSGPASLAFDDAGNLWVTNNTGDTVVRFAAADLAASGAPTPAATIEAASFAGTGPAGIALDHDGALWVTLFGNDTLVKIENAAGLNGSVTATVAVEIGVGNLEAGSPALWPPPPGLPIRTP